MERIIVIENVVRRLAAGSVVVCRGYREPTIEDDMEDISIAVFGGNPLPQEDSHAT